jgi:hypothetical protein
MKKCKMGRLIAAILTMAMAFTLLAVPASAANWAIEVDNVKLTDDDEPVAVVITNSAIQLLIKQVKEQAGGELDQISGLLDVAGKLASSNLGKMVLKMAPQILKQINEQIGDDDMSVKLYDGAVPSNKDVYIGIIGNDGSTTNWYTKDAAEQVVAAATGDEAANVQLNDDGTLIVGGTEIKPIPENELKWGNNTLLYVGAAVAVAGAATGIYFYTHPAAWEKVTTTVKNAWNKITGKTTEDAPAESEEESAETVTDTAAQEASEADVTVAAQETPEADVTAAAQETPATEDAAA